MVFLRRHSCELFSLLGQQAFEMFGSSNCRFALSAKTADLLVAFGDRLLNSRENSSRMPETVFTLLLLNGGEFLVLLLSQCFDFLLLLVQFQLLSSA